MNTRDVPSRDRPICVQCLARNRERRRGGRGGFYTRCSVCRYEDRLKRAQGIKSAADYQRERHEDRRAGLP